MIATATLLRVQFRMLRWVFITLVAGFAFIWWMKTVPDLRLLEDVAPISALLLALLVAWFSGPVLFGAEYSEGARDYLATRPVKPAQVFWTKMALLAAIAIIPAVLLPSLSEFTPRNIALLYLGRGAVAVAFLDIAIWSALMTVLFRDLIRGVLYSLVSIATVAPLIGWVWLYKVLPSVSGFSPGIRANHVLSVTVPAIFSFFLTPFLLLIPLTVVYHHQFTKRLRVPFPCVPLALAVALGLGSSIWLAYNNGASSTAESLMPETTDLWRQRVVGSCVQDRTLSYVRRYTPSNGCYSVYTLDLDDPGAIPATSSILTPTPMVDLDKQSWTTHVTGNHILFLRSGEDCVRLSCFTLPGGAEIEIEGKELLEGSVWPVVDLPDRSIGLCEYGSNEWFRLDTQEGVITSCEGAAWLPKFPKQQRLIGNRRYDFITGVNELDEFRMGIPDVTREGVTEVLCSLPLMANMAVDGDLLAGFTLDTSRGKYPWRYPDSHFDEEDPRFFVQDLVLYNLKVPSTPTKTIVQFPSLYWRPYAWIQGGLFDDSFSYYLPQITLGGGYLGVWHPLLGRVFFWDVSTPEEPAFIGTAALPVFIWIPGTQQFHSRYWNLSGPIVPMYRSDGAIGFVFQQFGPIWFEFPALMKEAGV